jgi:hypothetical protein
VSVLGEALPSSIPRVGAPPFLQPAKLRRAPSPRTAAGRRHLHPHRRAGSPPCPGPPVSTPPPSCFSLPASRRSSFSPFSSLLSRTTRAWILPELRCWTEGELRRRPEPSAAVGAAPTTPARRPGTTPPLPLLLVGASPRCLLFFLPFPVLPLGKQPSRPRQQPLGQPS